MRRVGDNRVFAKLPQTLMNFLFASICLQKSPLSV